MFPSLTQYLLQYKKVAIPHVGQFELVSKPAALDIADRLIYFKSYAAHFKQEDGVEAHQLHYLALSAQTDETIVSEQLQAFGTQLKQHIQAQGFEWKGIGRLEWSGTNGIAFQPSAIQVAGWQPVPANKVLRENVPHTVLVGEQEVQYTTSQQEVLPTDTRKRRRAVWIVAGLLAIAAAAFIAYYFYTHGLKAYNTGYQRKATIAVPQPTYR